jgi:hypothetical protein
METIRHDIQCGVAVKTAWPFRSRGSRDEQPRLEEDPMTKERLSPSEPLETAGDADFLQTAADAY